MKRRTLPYVAMSIIALGVYAAAGIFGIMHTARMASMDMPMERCPFGLGEHSMCQMNGSEHGNAWAALSRTGVPIVAWLALAVFVFWQIKLIVMLPGRFRTDFRRQRTKRSRSLYQALYSQGILNPKAP